ncbi:hypothetical protein PASE110613_08195 [Paenibacillus sediminis]|uniref:Uncharacterized protein n=1 Tax=Paenibacillus sediminis TaxID=664909 RepID=A0ABS4H2D1_9BACL|nr:hypothetical protein [Paenibacillus sediminis]MBP1936676.1 hypothetical protein [Paenibacillus sediminis]
MRNVWKTAMAVVLVGGGIGLGTILNTTADGASVSNQPGTADDPVVTKSYVDQQISQALGGGVSTGGNSGNTNSGSGTGSSATPAVNSVEIVNVNPGERLIAKAGAEFIVRSGKAVIYSPDANGVADLTDGIDVKNGQSAVNNHLLSYPRDGRGIQVQSGQNNGLIVMVRGGYEIQKAQ